MGSIHKLKKLGKFSVFWKFARGTLLIVFEKQALKVSWFFKDFESSDLPQNI